MKIRRRGEAAKLCQDPIKEDQTISRLFSAIFLASIFGCVKLADFLRETANVSRVTNATLSQEGGDSCAPYDVQSISDYLMGAIPFFFLTMVLELIFLKLSKYPEQAMGNFSAVDTWCSIAMGMTQLIVLEIFLRWANLRGFYCSVYSHVHNTIIPNSKFLSFISSTLFFWFNPTSWVGYFVAFAVDDLVYYWFHRWSHEVGFLWSGHQIHHSSERFNLSTAVRQSYWQGVAGSAFKLIQAPFIHPRAHMASTMWMTNYQFYFHTCCIRRYPSWFEFVFNTPSHHRVHHDRRVHKNFAGVFILWDRLFGTFRDERECEPMMIVDGEKETAKSTDEVLPKNNELSLFGIYDQVKSWTEAVTQIQWLVDHGLKHPIALLKGPGFYTTTKQRTLPTIANEPRLRQDDRPRGWMTNLYLCFYLFWVLYAVVATKMNKELNDSIGHYFSASVFALLALLTQGLVADRNFKTAMICELGRCVFAMFFHSVPATSLTVSVLSLFWIALMWDRYRPVKPLIQYFNVRSAMNEGKNI